MGMSHLGEFITGSNATSYSTTSSYAPTADRLLIAVVRNVNNLVTDPATPTFSGNGLTWTQVFTYLPDPTGTKSRITVFAALTGSSPTSGVGTADFGAETQLGCTVFVEEVDNADVSGTALDAIVQAVQGTQSGDKGSWWEFDNHTCSRRRIILGKWSGSKLFNNHDSRAWFIFIRRF